MIPEIANKDKKCQIDVSYLPVLLNLKIIDKNQPRNRQHQSIENHSIKYEFETRKVDFIEFFLRNFEFRYYDK